MSDIPKRDITGECEEECRDRVRELQEDQQEQLNKKEMKRSTEETSTVEHAKSRNRSPGDLGGLSVTYSGLPGGIEPTVSVAFQ